MIDVKGKSIKDISNIPYEDLEKLDRRDLAKLTSRLVSAANKRLRGFTQRGLSLNLKSLSNGVFSTKGKSKEELLKEFGRVSNFLEKKTSTVRGYKKHLRYLKNNILKGLDESEAEAFRSVYKKFALEGGFYEKFKYQLWDIIRTEVVTEDVPSAKRVEQTFKENLLDFEGENNAIPDFEDYKK